MPAIRFLPALDSVELAECRRRELALPWDLAASLGRSALEAVEQGSYLTDHGVVDWSLPIQNARLAKVSISPSFVLPATEPQSYPVTEVQVTNESTLVAARRLTAVGHKPLALNFANPVVPGGGFLRGATAQEESLCRSSALYCTLEGDEMYAFHRDCIAVASDWCILSPNVPVFRTDNGNELDPPWLLSFLTCAAPYAPEVGLNLAGELLARRIRRVLAIARAYRFRDLVLGAWGCGEFGNDVTRTALSFRAAIERDFLGDFSQIVFAIADWSRERRFLGPFRSVFAHDCVQGN